MSSTKRAVNEIRAENQVDALSTPTDLKPKATAAVAKELNKLVADAFALYLKTKNFHWHASGPHFRDYHKMFDEQADQIFAAIDPLAERVRKLGERTILGITHVADLKSIADNTAGFVAPSDMLKILMDDNKSMAADMRKVHAICDDNDDPATASLLEIYIDETERRTWFLFEASRPVDGAGH